MAILYFDTEFTERTMKGELIALGIITDKGKQFYAEFTDYSEKQIAEVQKTWNIKKYVLSKLYMTPEKETFSTDDTKVLGTREQVTEHLRNWLLQFDKVEFVCDRSAYSFVLLMQLFGGQDNIPPNMCPVLQIMNTLLARELRISDWDCSLLNRAQLAGIDEETFQKNKGNSGFDCRTVKQISEKYGLFKEE